MLSISVQIHPSIPAPAGTGKQEVADNDLISKIHLLANMKEDKSDLSQIILYFIVNNFDALAARKNQGSSDMSDSLQEAMVVLIMSSKDERDFSISQHDIITIFARFTEYLSAKSADPKIDLIKKEIKEEISKYLTNDLEFLLTNGVQRYNENSNALRKSITLDTKGFATCEDMLINISQYLSFHESIRLSKVCRSFHPSHEADYSWKLKLKDNLEVEQHYTKGKSAKQIFQEYPECRLNRHILVDLKGEKFFVTTLGCGPLTLQKIKNGELTFEEAMQRRSTAYEAIQTKLADPGLDADGRCNLMLDGSLACLMNNLASIEEIIDLDPRDRGFVSKLWAQKYLDKGMLSITGPYSLGLHTHTFMSDPWIQKYIDEGKLKVWEASSGRDVFANRWIQKNVDEGKITLSQAIDYRNEDLINREWQRRFEDGTLTIEQFEAYMHNDHGKKTIDEFLADGDSDCIIS